MRKIVIAQSGWVFIGEVSPNPAKGTVRLTDASVIRVWGTTKGVGEISLRGPTKATVLDPCGEVVIPLTSVVAELTCMT